MNDVGLAAARRGLADRLRDAGAIRSRLIYDAFAAVPRHVFLPEFCLVRDGKFVRHRMDANAATDLDIVYRDRTLVTRVDAEGHPVSSSTAPSVMAFLLEALALRPGLR